MSKHDERAQWFESYVRALENSTVVSAMTGEPQNCPCCGCKTLDERGGFEICPVCFWEDDGQDTRDANVVRGGPNGGLSLTTARANFIEFGACERRHVGNVRKPKASELP
jgi:Cysteine-rich CPCC